MALLFELNLPWFAVFWLGARAFPFDNIINRLLRCRGFFYVLFWRRGRRGRLGWLFVLCEADFGAFEDMYAHKTEDKKEEKGKNPADCVGA